MFKPSITHQLRLGVRCQSTLVRGDLKQYVIHQYQSHVSPDVKSALPGWQRNLGESVVSLFNIDMDKTRSGPIGAQLFRDMCKMQGYFPQGPAAELTKSKRLELPEREKFYYETLALPQTFQQQFQISTLHLWMLFVRLRALPRQYCREYQRKLTNAIFEDLGFRMRQEVKVNSESIINTHKKTMNEQLRGAIFSYDEGYVRDDATLSAALWRNLFNSNQDVDMVQLEQMTHYVRTQLYIMDQFSDRDFTNGFFNTFLEPWKRFEPLTSQDIAEIKAVADDVRRPFVENPRPSDRSVLSEEGF